MTDETGQEEEELLFEPAPYELPSGRTVWQLFPGHALKMLEQVQDYFRPEMIERITEPGAVVVDVGANLGFFAHEVIRRAESTTVHCLEPLPATFELLERNTESLGESVIVHPVGLSSTSTVLSFQYQPGIPEIASAYGISYDDEWIDRVSRAQNEPREVTERFFEKLAQKIETIECQVVTFSEFVRENSIARVDFLKIDVEKAELDVLEGISEPDWAMIQSVAIEVHDIDERLQVITELLNSHGLRKCDITQTPELRGTEIYNLSATR